MRTEAVGSSSPLQLASISTAVEETKGSLGYSS